MHPGGSGPPTRKGKAIDNEPPKRRRNRGNRDVVLNIGNMRGHTFLGPPATEPIAPRPPSPSGPGWYHLPSHGHFMGPPSMYPAGHTGAPAGHMGAPAGHMGAPAGHMGASSGHIGSSSGHTGSSSMPTPSPQDDIAADVEPQQDDIEDTDDETVEVVVIDGVALKVIYPSGDALLPAKVASSNITRVIRKMYFQKFHPKWTKVIDKDRDDLLDFFREKVTWREEDDDEVRRVFFKRMGAQLSDLLYKLRVKDKKPEYMSDEVWNAFKGHWATETFKSNSEKAKKNRNSEKGGSLHCCGSVNQAQHALRLSKKAGRPITAPELHRATHMRKGTDEFVDDRSRMTQEQINEIMTQLTQGDWDPASLGQLSPELRDLANKNWEKIVGWYKGRLYGTGPVAPTMGLSSGAGSSRGPSRRRPAPSNSAAETEQLRQELHSTQQELHDTRAEVRSWRADYEKVLRRQELMFKYFKNMLPDEEKDDEEDEEDQEEDQQAGESDGGSF